jgi:hypothetical protein
LVVDFINIAGPSRSNVGIVQLDAGNEQTTVYVKNYDDQQRTVPLKVGNAQQTLAISPKGTETYSFKTPAGATKIEIQANDDFPVDNEAFLSAPAGGKSRVLLVANNASTFLRNALLASGEFDVTITEPPVISQGDFDVIIINNIDSRQLLPGTFEDMKKKAEDGATVIVAVQDNSEKLDYRGLLPVKISGRSEGGFVDVEQLNRFTKNIDFGKTDYVLKAEPAGDQTVIASVGGIPAITFKPEGAGKLVYFGIPETSDFKYSPHFPIFWTELIKFVTEQQDVKNLNFKTGETLLLDEEQTIKTPTKVMKRAALILDEQGVYELEDRVIAVNLVDELESNINMDKKVGTKSVDYELKPVKETREFHWELMLLVIALTLVVFEVFFVKYRGDL